MARIKMRGRGAVYHCISRVVGGERLLDDVCKETLTGMLWKLAGFCGVEIITYCIMANHFHVLVRVPERGYSNRDGSPSDVGSSAENSSSTGDSSGNASLAKRSHGGGPLAPLADNDKGSASLSVTDAELLARMELLYGPQGMLTVLARQAMAERGRIDAEVRQGLVERMGDVSAFMKELKQRFSRWYNRRHQRFGTLWAERFKSVLVEDQPSSVEAVAVYIDLNPVRAGLVDDPKDYRFCGYAAALAGNKLARQGLMSFQRPPSRQNDDAFVNASHSRDDTASINDDASMDGTASMEDAANVATAPSARAPQRAGYSPDWSQCAAAYRRRMFVGAGTVHQSGKSVLDKEKIKEVLAQGGVLSLGEIFRLRVRHMTDGVALGTRGFVNEVFALHREKFGPKRTDGARPIRILASIGLNALRDLRSRALS